MVVLQSDTTIIQLKVTVKEKNDRLVSGEM